MDLALLVYGISLLSNLTGFFIAMTIAAGIGAAIFFLWYITETDRKSYYSDRENDQREANGVMCVTWIKRLVVSGFIISFLIIFIPTEKTAYTMVGAYAAQKVVENDKVQSMSGKVLTIIEQKLDGYIDEGITAAEDKVQSAKKNKSR